MLCHHIHGRVITELQNVTITDIDLLDWRLVHERLVGRPHVEELALVALHEDLGMESGDGEVVNGVEVVDGAG